MSRLLRALLRRLSRPIDVVIPAYRGLEATRTCVESVLAARLERRAEVIVIDDASPEPELSAYLKSVAASGRVALRRHESNRGFVASANEGMALHPDRDVVLLNSDTEVAQGWLDRLAACVERDRTIGTATPFSTNATICSYPRSLQANAIPQGETTASLDAAFAAANAGLAIDIPTAVGFCMYIARECLRRVGPFDLERYGAGYGEEVDFCMRARRAGYRNVLCADVFVHHVGEVSFGGTGVGRRAQAQATVDALYPEFQQLLAAFIPADPARPLRRRADLQRLRRHPGELRSTALQDGRVRLDWPRAGEEFALTLDPGRDAAALDRIAAFVAGREARIPPLDPRWLADPAA